LTLIEAATDAGRTDREAHTGWLGSLEGIETFLLLLAKAVRQAHTYPVTSQVCVDAVLACRAHLAQMDGPDETRFEVTPDALLLHDHSLGDNPFVRQELTRRLRRARVAALTVQRDFTARDLTRFCINLIRAAESTDRTISVADLMVVDGVEAMSVEVTARREVLPVAPAAPAQRDMVAHERRRRDEALSGQARMAHLFPPHRGWIRLDPAESYDAVTLADLAILVDDPNDLAAMLQRLVEDDVPEGGTTVGALEQRFGDVAHLFAGLEPRLSHVMFGKLAGAVMALPPAPRHDLLKRAILPAIFDGRPDASVLHAFPDADLAESLCLLLDGENAGQGMALSALQQLEIGPERLETILALMDELLNARIDPALGLDATTAIELDRQARRLTRIDATERRSFAELSGFDFQLDDDGRAAITAVRGGILATDGLAVEFTCLINLTGLQPNPEVAAAYVQRAMDRARQLAAAGRWRELATGLDHLSTINQSLRERRPEVTALVDSAMAEFATPEFATALMAQHHQGADSQAVALCIVDALGPAIAPSLLSLLETDVSTHSIAVELMCERATLFAPALAEGAMTIRRQSRPHVARILGYAGAGYEDAVSTMVDPAHERASREALRALSRIGTKRAAELAGQHARTARGWLSTAVVEALLHFPPESSASAIRDLLAHRPFVLAQPAATTRLIARAAQSKAADLEPVLRALLSLRYRFWNSQLVKVARCAEALMKR
jgi:hypothetical protein